MTMGYYISNPAEVVALPSRRFGSNDTGIERSDVVYETEGLKLWIYGQGERRTFDLVFRISELDLETFQTLDDLVEGERTPFYFVPDIDASPMTAIFVRKEKDFKPVEQNQSVAVNGTARKFYDYTLQLRQEPTDAEIDE